MGSWPGLRFQGLSWCSFASHQLRHTGPAGVDGGGGEGGGGEGLGGGGGEDGCSAGGAGGGGDVWGMLKSASVRMIASVLLKLPRFGRTVFICAGSTPNHSLTGRHSPSHGVVGMSLPRPEFRGDSGVRSSG